MAASLRGWGTHGGPEPACRGRGPRWPAAACPGRCAPAASPQSCVGARSRRPRRRRRPHRARRRGSGRSQVRVSIRGWGRLAAQKGRARTLLCTVLEVSSSATTATSSCAWPWASSPPICRASCSRARKTWIRCSSAPFCGATREKVSPVTHSGGWRQTGATTAAARAGDVGCRSAPGPAAGIAQCCCTPRPAGHAPRRRARVGPRGGRSRRCPRLR